MALSNDLISQFAKVTKDSGKTKSDTVVYGTIVISNDETYVQLDGSEILTPISTTTKVSSGERVPVMIKNHTATVTGNFTSPSVRMIDVNVATDVAYIELEQQITVMGGLVESKVDQKAFDDLGFVVQQNTSDIQQTPDRIKMEVKEAVGGLVVGGRNLLLSTKELPTGSSNETNKWWTEAVHTNIAGEDGFHQIDWNAVNQAESMVRSVKSPIFRLPVGWLGRKTVASLWVYADDWSQMTDGMVWRMFVTTGDRSSDYRYGRIRILNEGGELADGVKGDAPENGKWKRIWAEFDLTQDGLPMSGAVELPEIDDTTEYYYAGTSSFGITEQPQDIEVEVGSTVVLSMKALGAVSYQWQNSANGGTTWANSGLTGFNTDTLTFAMTDARYKYIWRCVITDANGNTLETRGASLLRIGGRPSITRQPVSADAVVGDTVTFSVAATGVASYRWYNSNNGVTWTATSLTGYNTADLTVPVTTARYNYIWKCILTRENNLTLETNIVQIRKPLDQATHAWIGYYCTRDAVLSLKMPQLEFGTLPTDWSPSPDDIDTAIDTAVSKVSAELVVQAGDISANATAIENVRDQVNSAAGSISSVASRVNTAEFNISALDSKISSKVEQTDFDELGNIVSQQGTEISQTFKDVLILAGRTVGGTNMLQNTAELKASNYSFDSSGASKMGTYAEDGDGGLRIVNSGSNVRWWLGHVSVTPGQQYAMSVRYKMNSGTSPIQFQYVYQDASYAAIAYGDSAAAQTAKTEDGWTYLSDVLTVPDNAQITQVHLAVRTGLDYELYTCDYNTKRPKFEMGSMPTDWSPHPEEFQAGSSVKITKDEIALSAPKTTISIPSEDGEQVVAKFDSDGFTGYMVTANNLAYCYTGPDVITVNPNATSAQITAGGYYKSLTEACMAVSGKYLGKTVTINVQGDTYGDAVLRGVVGGYPVTINGGGYSLYGTLTLTDCSVRIYVANLSIARPASNGYDYAVNVCNCTYVELYPAVIDGGGAGNALFMETGSTVWAREVELYNATHLIHTLYGADLTTLNLRGGDCTNFICTDGSVVKMNVTRPDGAWLKHNASIVTPSDLTVLTVDSGSAQPSTPTVMTAAYLMTNSDSYMGGGWSYTSDNDIWQGYTANRGRIRGCMWFDLSALNGKTIRQASLRLSMYTGYGRGVAVSVQLYGTNMAYTGRSGSPELTTSYGTIGSTNPGETNELTIPTQAITDLANGTIKALVLYSDDTAVYEGKAYSRNYARFYGESTGDDNTKPRLTVIYQ